MFDMMMTVAWVFAGLLSGAAVQGGSSDSTLTARPVRFFSPSTGSTVIEGTSEIQLNGLAGTGPTTRYRVEVAIADSAGLELVRNSWVREVPSEAARAPGASAVESFSFAAAPGRYRVLVRVAPDSGRALELATVVTAYAARPLASDLLLATSAREAADTSTPAPGEIRRGRYVLRTAPVPHLTFAEAGLTYYTELYPWPGFTGGETRLTLEVLSEAGRPVIRAVPQQLRIGARGGVARGTMDLTGLPQGNYRLRATIAMGDSSAQLESPFTMGPVRNVVAAVAAPVAASDMFESMDEVALDSLFAPLTILAQASELGSYSTLTIDGKRRFMREFWARRDPSPNTPDNPRRDVFYRGVRHANTAYREGGTAQIPGWRTDRGRVYLKYGEPNEYLRRPAAQPNPFEVWLYTRDRRLYYVFRDRTGLGHYELIGTNDVNERGQGSNWIYQLGPTSAQEVTNFIQ